MKQSVLNTRIPTLLALSTIIIGIAATSYLVQAGILSIGFASPDENPETISITNITDTSFSVAFTTKLPTKSYIEYGETENLSQISYNSNSQNENLKDNLAHLIEIKNLKKGALYYFQIKVNNRKILNDGKLFTAKTAGSQITSQKDQKKISGKVLLPDATYAFDALVYLNIEGAQIVATKTNEEGEYYFATDSIRSSNLQNNFEFANNTLITLQIARAGISSEIKTTYGKAEIIPPSVLTKNYDFTQNLPVISDVGKDVTTGLLQIPTPPGAVAGKITIIDPSPDDSLIDQKPLFQGSALPNQKVKIIIESNPLVTEVTTDKNGIWKFRPSESLPPGKHTITIETKDQFGIIKRIKQTFTVYAQGSQLDTTGTPTPTTNLTTAPTSQITPSPTTKSSPTLPTATATPTRTTTQSPFPSGTTSPGLSLTTTPKTTITNILTPSGSITSSLTKSLTPTQFSTTSATLTAVASITYGAKTTPRPTPSEQPGDLSTLVILTFAASFIIITGIVLYSL